jgi:hypothetical protein
VDVREELTEIRYCLATLEKPDQKKLIRDKTFDTVQEELWETKDSKRKY